MLYPRIIPCLLVHKKGLVKTTKFKDPKYVGDPINAVKKNNIYGIQFHPEKSHHNGVQILKNFGTM